MRQSSSSCLADDRELKPSSLSHKEYSTYKPQNWTWRLWDTRLNQADERTEAPASFLEALRYQEIYIPVATSGGTAAGHFRAKAISHIRYILILLLCQRWFDSIIKLIKCFSILGVETTDRRLLKSFRAFIFFIFHALPSDLSMKTLWSWVAFKG